jgi:acetyl esterase/lipase
VADTDADTATDKEKHSSYLGDGIYCRRYENEVDKQLNNNNNEGYFCLDTISKPSEGPKSKRKVFFYIHGGGWKGGSPTLHSHTVLLMNMAKQGWLVISTNYKKHCWPDHIEGCVSNFAWLEAHADNLQINADMSHVVISGASAGKSKSKSSLRVYFSIS